MEYLYFCIERPFTRDARLTPYVDATGYSFPSGHTMLATGFYGGVALRHLRHPSSARSISFLPQCSGLASNQRIHILADAHLFYYILSEMALYHQTRFKEVQRKGQLVRVAV